MRPVAKLEVGDTVIILDENGLEIQHTIQEIYNPYQSAKEPLEKNIGEYCSYCERPVSDEAVAVEHVQAKSLYPGLTYRWSNFLLACARCNGMDNKGNKDVILGNIHLPHLNNTLLSIAYGQGGLVSIHPSLIPSSSDYNKAKALIDLVGLDKRPGHSDYKRKDKRWFRRDEVWQLATRHEAKYRGGTQTIDTIIDLAKGRGFFSVWFTIFEAHLEVKQALIDGFNGTARDCFDTGYNPIPRNAPNV